MGDTVDFEEGTPTLGSETISSDSQHIDDEQGEDLSLSSQDENSDELRERYETGTMTDADLDKIADLAVSFLRNVLSCFGEDEVVVDEYDGDDGELILDITGGDLAVLIGRHGRTLDALQLLTSSYLANMLHFHFPLVVDIEGYKTRRREKLESLARSAASRAKRQHSTVKLAPMNAYERRLVHLALVDDVEVTTHSEGTDPDRRVVITYVRA